MTNNDKAIAALTEDEIKSSFVEFINWVKPNTGLSPSTVGTIQKLFKEVLIRQALTPQSSADLGRVLRERVEGMRKDSDLSEWNAGHNAAITKVLHILDEFIGRAE